MPNSSIEHYPLDFFDDTIETARTYDPISQKSIQKVDQLFLSPASEWHCLKEEKRPSLLWEYLGINTLVVFNELLNIEDHHVKLQDLPGSKTPFFSSLKEHINAIASLQKLLFSQHAVEELSTVQMEKRKGRSFYSGKDPLQPLSFSFADIELKTERWRHPFIEIPDFLSLPDNKKAIHPDEFLSSLSRLSASTVELHFVSGSEAEENKLQQRLSQQNITLPKNTSFDRGYLTSGFVLEDTHLIILPQTEMTHRYKPRRQQWRSTHHTPASEFHELCPGDIVVHFHNGIGKFLGLGL